MGANFNTPNMAPNADGKVMIPRWQHQAVTLNHQETQIEIKENGRVILKRVDQKASTKDEVVYDEMEMSAALVFKIARWLKDTRRQVFVEVDKNQANKFLNEDE